ncbi:hypothetical protein Tco_0723942 [Tanacetum coccineum]
MLSQGCLDWNIEVLYGFMQQQLEKGKGGRKHHLELIPESIRRMKMKGVLVVNSNATWPVDEEEQKNNLLGEKFTELVNNSTNFHYRSNQDARKLIAEVTGKISRQKDMVYARLAGI